MIWLPFRSFPQTTACLRDEDLEELWQDVDQLICLLIQESAVGPFTRAWNGRVGSALVLLLAVAGERRLRAEDRTRADRPTQIGSSAAGGQLRASATGAGRYTELAAKALSANLAVAPVQPSWLGRPALHLSHQSTLIRKDPSYYASRFPHTPLEMPLLWPVDWEGRSLEIFTDADWGQFSAGRLVIPEDLREGVEIDEVDE